MTEKMMQANAMMALPDTPRRRSGESFSPIAGGFPAKLESGTRAMAVYIRV